MWEKTISIHSVLWGKLQRFPQMIEPYLSLLIIVILNYLNIKKNKIGKDNFRKKQKTNMWEKNIVAIHSNLRGKLQCFPHIL